MTLPTKRVVELRDQVAVRHSDISQLLPERARLMLIDASLTGEGSEIVRGPDGGVDEIIVSPGRVRAIAEATARIRQQYPQFFKQPSRSTHVRR